jgi:hypothetical protein
VTGNRCNWRLADTETAPSNQEAREKEKKWRVTYEGRLERVETEQNRKKGLEGRFACAREEERVLIQTGGPIWDWGRSLESF